MKRVLQFLAAVIVLTGIRYCSKDSFHDKFKAEYLSTCEDDEKCIHFANSTLFESCFEEAFTLGKRSTFNEMTFFSCAETVQNKITTHTN